MILRTVGMGALVVICAAAEVSCSSSRETERDASIEMPTDGFVTDGGSSQDASVGDAGSPCSPYQAECAGRCISVVVDPKNCGGCNVTCTGADVCSGGKCSAGCLPGLVACAQSCVDTRSDNAHCGACNTPCKAGEGCSDGQCKPSVPLADGGSTLCTGGGPPIVIGDADGGTQCLGNIAQTTFTWALCSCTDITFSASVLTDGYDSSKGPYVPGGLGGGVGLNGAFAASVPKIDIGGTLWEASTKGMSQQAETEVHQELHVGGPLFGRQLLVGGDAHVTGDVSGAPGDPIDSTAPPPYLKIQGKLYMSSATQVSGRVSYAPPILPQTSPTGPPCDCKNPVPVADITAWAKTHNDNAKVGIDPTLLSSLSTPPRLDLPCGAFYFDAMKLTGPFTLVAHGRTAIFVDGDVFTTSPLEITVDPTGTLDIFIVGTISSVAHLWIGNPNYPALVRIYVGTKIGIPFTGGVTLSGNLYAANSNLVSWSSAEDIYGSVIAGNFISSAATKIHYDRGVLSGGSDCPDGSGGCGSCKDCGNQACIKGQCAPCTSSDQCCAPLVCVGGTCMATPIP